MKVYKLTVTEKAEHDFSIARNYYEEKQRGLGSRFEFEVNVLLGLITKNPLLFSRKYKQYREALVTKFPYFVVYEITDTTIIIHSFFHTSRNPLYKPS